jgi:hypothetical protein
MEMSNPPLLETIVQPNLKNLAIPAKAAVNAEKTTTIPTYFSASFVTMSIIRIVWSLHWIMFPKAISFVVSVQCDKKRLMTASWRILYTIQCNSTP